MEFVMDSRVRIFSELSSEAVCRAVDSLRRDVKKVLIGKECGERERRIGDLGIGELGEGERRAGEMGADGYEGKKVGRGVSEEKGSGGGVIRLVKEERERECFVLEVRDGELVIGAGDDLGFVYGVYEISRRFLGIGEFWFWNDQEIGRVEEIVVPEGFRVEAEACQVRFRGWFLNDEVLLHTWMVDRQVEKGWEMALEALLRCRGNLVIPGTDRNAEKYSALAKGMGLYVTHHHAEPLGAPMFARVYPGKNPSYAEHSELFQGLWREGIARQKGTKVVYNLGFRGQGDCPFWEHDPQYQTNEARGRLISELIGLQYRMVKEAEPDAVCCTNLYGETMELYREGFLKLPEEVIQIWADNGYGKMVSRRQDNHNPRVRALPKQGDLGRHGIYYHVSFYDLQAANHITMLPNSAEFVQQELGEVLDYGMDDYWIINCSNVKPHVYLLDFIKDMWRYGEVEVDRHRRDYVNQYYQNRDPGRIFHGQDRKGEGNDAIDKGAEEKNGYLERIMECLGDYSKYALAYGEQEDEHAGEQFMNHVARIAVSQYMKDSSKQAEELLWMKNSFVEKCKDQVPDAKGWDPILWYQYLCRKGQDNYAQYYKECQELALTLSGHAKTLFQDSLLLQAQIYYNCFQGACLVCDSLVSARQGSYQKAFYKAGCAKLSYEQADAAMRQREHGKWHNFYANECLTDIKQTAWVLKGFMSYLRNLGDGPHFYQWQREFLYAEEDRRVMLILNMENHLRDEELWQLMDEKWGDSQELSY